MTIENVDKSQPMREAESDSVDRLNELIDYVNAGGGTTNTIDPNKDTTPAKASGDNAIAVGGNSQANAENSTAVGWGTLAANQNTTVVGNIAGATGYNGTAIGKGANADGVNSVALGQGSLASEQDTVSVGTSDLRRRIVNVANPVDPNDAVNKRCVWLLEKMHLSSYSSKVAASSTATLKVSRYGMEDPEKYPLVFACVQAYDDSKYYGNVTTGYYADESKVYIIVNNPNNFSLKIEVSILVVELGV